MLFAFSGHTHLFYCDLVRKHPVDLNDICVLTTSESGVEIKTVKFQVAVSAV